VASQPDAPVALDKTYPATAGETLNISAASGLLVGATDGDGDQNLTAVRVTQATQGTVTVNPDGSFTYVAKATATGVDTFTYKIVDSTGLASRPKTVTFNLSPPNIQPVAKPDSGYSTSQNVNLVVAAADGVLQNDSDGDAQPLRAFLVDQPAHGSVTLNTNGSFTYKPATNFAGTDTFTYVARDNSGAANNTSAKATVTIQVAAVNHQPTAEDKTYNVKEDNTLVVSATNSLLLGAADQDGNPLTAVFVSLPDHGSLISKSPTGSFTYRPAANYHGSDSFTYRVSDGDKSSALHTVTIQVASVNDPPPAVDDSATVFRDTADQLLPDVLANDRAARNVDGAETLSLVAFPATTAQGGSLTKTGTGRLEYTPKAGFVGTDTFTYTVSDGHGGRNQAQVTIHVQASAPSTVSGFVYRDANGNGRRDADEPGIGGVKVHLEGIGNATDRSFVTKGNGAYSFAGVLEGRYRITESQPAYLRDGNDTLGSAGGDIANDSFTLDVPNTGGQVFGYNFGEGRLAVGTNANGDPPLQLTLQEITAKSTNLGALIGLDGDQQEWFTTLDPSWKNVSSLKVQISSDSSKAFVTLVVSGATYHATILTTEADELHFRIAATNNQGFQVIRLDGALDLSMFARVASSTPAADEVFGNW
jgi:VCBS repeat-containing protein